MQARAEQEAQFWGPPPPHIWRPLRFPPTVKRDAEAEADPEALEARAEQAAQFCGWGGCFPGSFQDNGRY